MLKIGLALVKLLTLQTFDSNELFGSLLVRIQGTIGDDVIDGNGGTDTVDDDLGEIQSYFLEMSQTFRLPFQR